MADLPTDVRDRATDPTGRCSVCGHHPGPIGADCWCDCHDEALAAEQPERQLTEVAKIAYERDALKARVAELEETLSDNRKLWDESIAQTDAALELHNVARARVDLLTTALTELVDIVDESSYLVALSNNDHDRVEHARAALSVAPTEDKT